MKVIAFIALCLINIVYGSPGWWCHLWNSCDDAAPLHINVHRSVNNGNSGYGRYTDIYPRTKIGTGTSIGDHTTIESNCDIGDNCVIGNHCNLGSADRIGNNTRIGNHVSLGASNEVGDNTRLDDHVQLDSNIKIGSNSAVFEHATLNDYAAIGSGSIVDQHSTVGANAITGSNVYLVGENAVIHHHVTIQDGTTVDPDEVVVRSPTSAALYAYCMPLGRVPEDDAQLMTRNSQQPISSEANDLLREKLNDQIHHLSSNCEHGRNIDANGRALIKSLYLILYHGIDDFHKFSQLSGSEKLFLSMETHFGRRAIRNVLTSEVKDLMVKLLALEEDLQRSNRVSGDTFCTMAQGIGNGQRKARVDL